MKSDRDREATGVDKLSLDMVTTLRLQDTHAIKASQVCRPRQCVAIQTMQRIQIEAQTTSMCRVHQVAYIVGNKSANAILSIQFEHLWVYVGLHVNNARDKPRWLNDQCGGDQGPTVP
jgi:hypothetical protein